MNNKGSGLLTIFWETSDTTIAQISNMGMQAHSR